MSNDLTYMDCWNFAASPIPVSTDYTMDIYIEEIMKKNKEPDYLTLCAIAAQEAGMSYGKYMAMHGYHPPIRIDAEGVEVPQGIPKICPNLGKCFTTVRPNGKSIAALIASGHSATDKPPSDTGTGKRRKERR